MKRCANSDPVVDRLVIAMSLLVLALLGVGNQSATAEDSLRIRCAENAQQIGSVRARSGTTTAKRHGRQVADSAQGSPGLRAYVDPVTGEFGVPPSWAARRVEALAPGPAYSTSHEGLVETPSPVPGGGVMVDLQGRFRNPMTAMLDADGRTKMQHTPCLDVSGDTQ